MANDTKILLVDDSAFMRNVLKNILQEAGYQNFIESSDGNEAIEKFKTEKPELLLLDIIMPVKGGEEVLEEIGKDAKVIVISAVGQESVIEECKKKGASGYIVKPFDNEKVVAEVKKVLGE